MFERLPLLGGSHDSIKETRTSGETATFFLSWNPVDHVTGSELEPFEIKSLTSEPDSDDINTAEHVCARP